MSALQFEDVGFTYPGAPAPALRRCSFRADGGSVTWITGALGAGTSTALLVAAGLAPRHTGGELTGTVVGDTIELETLDAVPAMGRANGWSFQNARMNRSCT